MQRFLYLLFAFCVCIPVHAQELLPQFFDNGNAGTEFYLTFLPTQPQAGGVNNVKIYVFSTVETNVVLEVKAQGYIQSKKTKPNAITEFILPVTLAQAYFKTENDPTPKEAIYRQQAVHLFANDPIVVYGLTNYQSSREGFLGLPISALGTEYVIASYADAGDNGTSLGRYLPSEAGIVAAFDNTKVTFTLGGNSSTRTSGGMKPEETKIWNLQKGDVLMLTSLGKGADLSGSKIVASRPIGVISGSYCVSIPNENSGNCNHIVEMELPTHTWGKEYIVTKIFGRQKNSILRIMAKEPDTKIFINGMHKNTIATAGGVEGSGYIVRRPDEGAPGNFVITADKPICVTQFNPGQGDDGVESIPFQLVLPPVDHFVRELAFAPPGIGDGSGFPHNYVNLVFELDENGEMSDDLEVAFIDNGEFEWTSVKGKYGSFFEQLHTVIAGRKYGVKTIKLQRDGLYRVRSPLAVFASCYGFSEHGSYAYPAGVSLADRSGGIDTLPPVPVYTQYETGDVLSHNSSVSDSNPGWNSRLARVSLIQSMSFNYNFSKQEFIPGESINTTWQATVIDRNKPARAVIVFMDRAGNDTTITLEFEGVKIASAKIVGFDFGTVTVGQRSNGYINIKSTGNKDLVVKSVDVPQSSSFIIDLPAVPFTVPVGSSMNIPVYFEPRAARYINSRLVFHLEAKDSTVVADVYGTGRAPDLTFTSWSFSFTEVGESSEGHVDLINIGTEPIRITALQAPKGPAFTILYTPDFPFVLNPGETMQLPVRFVPPDTGNYEDEIRVAVHDFERTSTLFGQAVKNSTGVSDELLSLPAMQELYPNPAGEEATLHYTLARTERVRLALFNTMGQEVLSLFDGMQVQGDHTVRMHTGNVPPGMYVCRLSSGNTTVSSRLVIAR